MAFRKYEYLVVRPAFSQLKLSRQTPLSPSDRRFSAGSLGPAAFGLGLRDSCLVILFFNLLCAIAPSYL